MIRKRGPRGAPTKATPTTARTTSTNDSAGVGRIPAAFGLVARALPRDFLSTSAGPELLGALSARLGVVPSIRRASARALTAFDVASFDAGARSGRNDGALAPFVAFFTHAEIRRLSLALARFAKADTCSTCSLEAELGSGPR